MTTKFIRPAVEALDAYVVEPPNYSIIVNANENPFDFPKELKEEICQEIMKRPLNRYPDATAKELRGYLSDYTGIAADQIICGCGSDEIIEMINEAFVNPGDVVLGHSPSFSMYQIWSCIGGADFHWIDDRPGHHPDIDGILAEAEKTHAKIIYLCNPNNPTGFLFSPQDILTIIQESGCLVVLDEAYIEFKGEPRNYDFVDRYDNVLIMKTFSKAFGLAGIRLGYCMGSRDLIDAMYKVKSPYNLNTLTQIAGIVAMQNRDKLLDRLKILTIERRKLYKILKDLPIERVYPTASNFIYFETSKGQEIYDAMKENDILIKYYKTTETKGLQAVRLTVGSPEENEKIVSILKEVLE